MLQFFWRMTCFADKMEINQLRYFAIHDTKFFISVRVALKSNCYIFLRNYAFKRVVHTGNAFLKAHNFLFLHNNLIKISGIVVRNL